MPAMAVAQTPPRSLRLEAICSPGEVIVGTMRPSTAGPRLLKLAMVSMLPTRKLRDAAVTMRFLASFGAVSVVAPGPELPAENTSMKGSATPGGVEVAVAHHEVVGALRRLVAVRGAFARGPRVVAADGAAEHRPLAVLLPAAGRRPGGGGERVHGEDVVLGRDAEAVEEATGVGEAAGGVAADDAGDVGAVAAARAVGAGGAAGIAAGGDAGEAEAADDVAAEVGVVVVDAGVDDRPAHAGAVDAEGAEVGVVADDRRAAGVVAGEDLVGHLVVERRPRALEAEPEHLGQRRHRVDGRRRQAHDGVGESVVGLRGVRPAAPRRRARRATPASPSGRRCRTSRRRWRWCPCARAGRR